MNILLQNALIKLGAPKELLNVTSELPRHLPKGTFFSHDYEFHIINLEGKLEVSDTSTLETVLLVQP